MDDILKNSLTGTLVAPSPTPSALTVPTPVKDNQRYIKTLGSAQKQPSALLNLQKAMQLSSRVAYNQRQKAEMEISGKQFDPTKVSGNTFAGIIGNLETKRGTDVSKIYASTMQTYQVVQQEISRRLERLQEIEESKRRWEEEMEMKKEEMEEAKKYNKKEYEMKKEQFEMAKKDWEQSYAKSSKGVGSSDYLNNLYSSFKSITMGEDNYLNPEEFNYWSGMMYKEADNYKELTALDSLIKKAKDRLNPNDTGYNLSSSTSGGWE